MDDKLCAQIRGGICTAAAACSIQKALGLPRRVRKVKRIRSQKGRKVGYKSAIAERTFKLDLMIISTDNKSLKSKTSQHDSGNLASPTWVSESPRSRKSPSDASFTPKSLR
jgi:hypothetical protein